LPLEHIQELIETAKFRDRTKNSYTIETLKDDIHERKKKLVSDAKSGAKLNPLSVKSPCPKTFEKIRKIVAPDAVKSVTQNLRRLEALIDFYNHLTLAVMWLSITEDADGKTVPTSNIFNVDCTSIQLETVENDTKIYLASGNIF
jgi:hypothetical protein